MHFVMNHAMLHLLILWWLIYSQAKQVVLKKHSASGGNHGKLAVVQKKPSAIDDEENDGDSDPSQLDAFHDRVKANKFRDVWDSLPPAAREADTQVVHQTYSDIKYDWNMLGTSILYRYYLLNTNNSMEIC